jgi:hypothetical protein
LEKTDQQNQPAYSDDYAVQGGQNDENVKGSGVRDAVTHAFRLLMHFDIRLWQ